MRYGKREFSHITTDRCILSCVFPDYIIPNKTDIFYFHNVCAPQCGTLGTVYRFCWAHIFQSFSFYVEYTEEEKKKNKRFLLTWGEMLSNEIDKYMYLSCGKRSICTLCNTQMKLTHTVKPSLHILTSDIESHKYPSVIGDLEQGKIYTVKRQHWKHKNR